MTQGVDPQDIYHNGAWYSRNGTNGNVAYATDTGITWMADGDQQLMGNADVSKFHVGGVAAATGGLATLIGGGDFAHYYFAHNFTQDATGTISVPDDVTSSSYAQVWTDLGVYNVYHAPSGASVVFNTTPTYSLNLLNGLIATGSQAISGSLAITQLATPGQPTGTPSASGGTMTASATNYAKIAALDTLGVTLGSTESVAVVTSGTTASIAWTWTEVPKAVSYRIYVGTTTGAEANYGTSTTNSFTQTANAGSGNVATSGTPQTFNNTGQLTTAAAINTPNVYSSGNVSTRNFINIATGRAVNTGTTAITIPANVATSYLSGISASGVTITLSAPGTDGERRRIVFGGASTGITWAFTAPATAQVGLPTTVTAGQAIEIVYNSVAGTPANSSATTWYQY